MVDSVHVLPPGWRASDNNHKLITDGILSFFEAGTNSPLPVFSDAGLTVSLGTTVNCNSTGVPVSSSNVRTLIYVGPDPYKIRLSSEILGQTVFEFDNVKGAIDTSGFLTDEFRSGLPIANVSANRSVTADDNGTLINVNCTSGTLTMTIADASVLGNDWHVGIRHDGTANFVKIIGDGADTFAMGLVVVTGFSLVGRGHTVWLACDGVSFKVYSEFPPLIGATTPTITVADRLSTPPGSPSPGQRYIVTSSPLGAWSTFAEHDIAEADGFGGWFRYTPPTGCGWMAYVQDEGFNYQFKATSWVTEIASTTLYGHARFATTTEVEANTAELAVSPATQHRHTSAAKFWLYVTVTGGVPAITASYNITSVTDVGVGFLGVIIATDFSSANWCALATGGAVGGQERGVTIAENQAAGSVEVTAEINGTTTDPGAYYVVGFGDQ